MVWNTGLGPVDVGTAISLNLYSLYLAYLPLTGTPFVCFHKKATTSGTVGLRPCWIIQFSIISLIAAPSPSQTPLPCPGVSNAHRNRRPGKRVGRVVRNIRLVTLLNSWDALSEINRTVDTPVLACAQATASLMAGWKVDAPLSREPSPTYTEAVCLTPTLQP